MEAAGVIGKGTSVHIGDNVVNSVTLDTSQHVHAYDPDLERELRAKLNALQSEP